MYVTLTRVSTAEQPIGNATIVGEEMERWLRDFEGFRGFLMLSREGTTLGISIWESRDAAERSRALRVEFIERVSALADVEIEGMEEFEVAYARVGPLASDAP